MNFNEYQKLAARTINNKLNDSEKLLHSLFGIAGEVGELQSIYQKWYQGHDIEESHLKKEAGDLLWFLAEYCTVNGWKFNEIVELNIDKLKARYPEGFTEEDSLNRKEYDI